MKTVSYLWLSLGACMAGMLFFGYHHGWIIIQNPFATSLYSSSGMQGSMDKKTAKLVFWQHDRWNTEKRDLLWPADKAQAATYLINSWLTLLDEEMVMDKKVMLQSAIIGAQGTDLYLSFDCNPLVAETTVYAKWHWVESLLKTLRENDISVKTVQLLVHHQPLVDDHLDFTHPWPLKGFLDE